MVSALRNAVATSTEVHAYLFSGPRGTGKTSTARILAKALNCENLTDGEPCCECDSCVAMEKGGSFDLFELDAASNNGVDAIRDLVDRAAVSSPGRTKVYILDEVHMLTTAASNALLKTLEEPPDHVCFVLATTDPQKVLPTIQSRTQHFRFQLLTAAELDSYVRWIATDAGLEVADSEVEHVVREGRGSARDTLTALDQVVAAGGVAVVEQPVEALFEAMQQASAGVAVAAVASAIEQGSDPRVLGEAFLGALRDAFLVSMGVSTQHMLEVEAAQATDRAGSLGPKRLTAAMESIGEALVEMRQAADPRIPLEVALVRLSASAGSASEAASVPEAGSAAPAGSASAAPAESATTGAAEASHGAEIAELQRQIGVLTRKVEALEARGNGVSQKSPAPPTPPPRKRRREPTGATAASQSSAEPQRPTETPRPTPAPEPAQRAEPSTSDSPSAGAPQRRPLSNPRRNLQHNHRRHHQRSHHRPHRRPNRPRWTAMRWSWPSVTRWSADCGASPRPSSRTVGSYRPAPAERWSPWRTSTPSSRPGSMSPRWRSFWPRLWPNQCP